MNNIYQEIATMRRKMKAVGYTREEIANATLDVEDSESYEEALQRIKKYWK